LEISKVLFSFTLIEQNTTIFVIVLVTQIALQQGSKHWFTAK